MALVNNALNVGVIQTSLHDEAAWVDDKSGNWQQCVRMSLLEERRAKKEIRHYLAALRGLDRQPDIVLLPELAVPIGFEHKAQEGGRKTGINSHCGARLSNRKQPTASRRIERSCCHRS